eukprot:2775990-Ditylum_brightwellii.AAC.1
MEISFISRAPSTNELEILPHVHMTSNFQWNSESIVLGKIETLQAIPEFINIEDTEQWDYLYKDPTLDKSILHSQFCSC